MALEIELQHYESIKADLLRHHEGKYVLIIDRELLGAFDNWDAAYQAGLAAKGNVPMLIKHVLKEETPESIPAMTLGLLSAHL